jgi:hypothetical protein
MQFTTYTRMSLDLAQFYKINSNVRHVCINITNGNCSELLRRPISPLRRKRLKDVSPFHMSLRAT